MTDKIQETRRALFEAWARKHNDSLKEDQFDQPEDIKLDKQGGVYIWANAESGWLAFNAALDAVEIELPSRKAVNATLTNSEWFGVSEYNLGMFHSKLAIESTGLGIKVR